MRASGVWRVQGASAGSQGLIGISSKRRFPVPKSSGWTINSFTVTRDIDSSSLL
jgi:hypothetical protein